ncbi:hypothetical protein NLG97_g10767 [Lecanicillium saksenae]|uniref:Uncharacterized protein n=1 Tax=Lecanicillium saksenae TaxID=468837 RepID=A0ACC1QEQ8_9HYPO|nr:hypothetical protein NLG97_g10767 [Lecanicillium saksenae]
MRNSGVDMGEELPELMDTVKVTAATFEEYRPGGTWVEGCARRMYHSRKVSCRPEIPLQERPNPELERVHDVDIEFRPVPIALDDDN